jgi:flagellar protein FliO/FliZ
MARTFDPRSSCRGSLRLCKRLVGVIGIWSLFVVVNVQANTDAPARSGESGLPEIVAAVAGSAVGNGSLSPPSAEPVVPVDQPRPSRSWKPRRIASTAYSSGSDAWYWEMGGIVLVLAVCGGLVAAARRFLPQGAAGELQVLSRVSLSPKHSIYMLRAGRRVLLLGAGPQGAPVLISELDDFPENPPTVPQGEES